MLDAIKPLLDSDLINEDTRQEISEAWEAKLNEARNEIRAELREEFAGKYEHDKQVMVEALDRMVTDGITSEVQAVKEEKKALAEDRVRFNSKLKENATKFNDFMVSKLAEEIGELREERGTQEKAISKMESFVTRALAEEIAEFQKDKQAVVETRVRLVSEARDKLETLKKKFVQESSGKMSQAVAKHLKAELGQLKEDIKAARENTFGRRIFEAFASEFGTTHLNENAEMRELKKILADKDQKLAEATETMKKQTQIVESKERRIRMIEEGNKRNAVMEELLAPLNEEKQEVMKNLLENVQTSRLRKTFDKYLPAVLAENGNKKSKKQTVTESVREVTGDKTAQTNQDNESQSNVIDLKRLAGL